MGGIRETRGGKRAVVSRRQVMGARSHLQQTGGSWSGKPTPLLVEKRYNLYFYFHSYHM
jgi:hypothetical protein